MSFLVSYDKDKASVYIQQRFHTIQKGDIFHIRNAYSDDGVYKFAFIEKLELFTIPVSGTYKLEAWGANGASESPTTGPKGAYSKSFCSFVSGDKISILVGEKGYKGCALVGGGGGGSFIVNDTIPLCIAGGGGSSSYYVSSPSESYACGQATQEGGNPGTGSASLKMGGKSTTIAAGGGGFEGNGDDATLGTGYGKGGYSFKNGGKRQTEGTHSTYRAYGGFGGGGSSHGNQGHPAGGGGYTGGSASNNDSKQGGGGGSYFIGKYEDEESNAISGCDTRLPANPSEDGNGYVILSLLKATGPVPKHISSCYNKHLLWTLYATIES